MNPLAQQNNLVPIDPSAIASKEMARATIESAYQMATYNKRDQDDARDRILAACKRPSFAEIVEYSKPIGGKPVTGPSIRFVELALREWGNVSVQSPVIYEDETVRRVRVTVLDLETNAQFSKDIQVKRTVERRFCKGREDDIIKERTNSYGKTVYILTATEEEMDIKASSAISKAIRTEGGRLLPQDIVEDALEIARQTLKNRDSKDPQAAKRRLLDSFSAIGVKPKHIKEFLEHDLEILSPPELEELRKMYASISEGGSTWADYMAEKEPDPNAPPSASDLTKALHGEGDTLPKPKPTKKKKAKEPVDPPPDTDRQEPNSQADVSDEDVDKGKLIAEIVDLKKGFSNEYEQAKKLLGLEDVNTVTVMLALKAKMNELIDTDSAKDEEGMP